MSARFRFRPSSLTRPARAGATYCVLLASLFTACSFIAPPYQDFVGTRPAVGGGAGDGFGASSGSDDGGSVEPGGGAGTSGMSALSGTAGMAEDAGSAGAAGVAGEPETPDAPAVSAKPVADADVVLEPVVTLSLPAFAAISNYAVDEAAATAAGVPAPLYAPYASTDAAWWDNLVAEQTQARVPLIVFPTRGAYTLDASDINGPGDENPRRLAAWVAALARTTDKNLFTAICLVDTPFLMQVANQLHGAAADTPLDLAQTSDWNDVFWARAVQPWYETIPTANWYLDGDGPLIAFGPITDIAFKNASGNLSKLLSALTTSFNTRFGKSPHYLLDSTWFSADSSLTSNAQVVAQSPWLQPTSASFAFSSYHNYVSGTLVPGYSSASLNLVRQAKDNYGNTVVTLVSGLAGAVTSKARITLLQGFTNLDEAAGFYRSTAWQTPNQNLNLVRRYSDLRTFTLRLEAEGCDRFSDTTPGNSAGAFRRSGDLDVRQLASGSGWAVTGSAAGEWLEFDNVDFSSGAYQFAARYSTSGGGAVADKRLELVIDGVKLVPVIVPNTTNVDNFNTILLGTQMMTHGTHTLRLRFLDGLLDVDWLFVKKLPVQFGLKLSAGNYVSANGAGGSTLNYAPKALGIFEQFVFDDLNGGALEDGDRVNIQTRDGLYLTYTPANDGIAATQRVPASSETFTVNVIGGPLAKDGAQISVLMPDNAHYMTANAAGPTDASGTDVADAQTFTLVKY